MSDATDPNAVPAYTAAVLGAIRAAQVAGRLPAPASEILGDIFPFESPLTFVAIDEPVLPEPPRSGEDGRPCHNCDAGDEQYLWTDEAWRLRSMRQPEAVHAFLLEPREHFDLDTFPDARAAQLGGLLARIERAIRTGIDGVGRVHINRWADGGNHMHWWFIVRPAGLLQLRGSNLPLWMEVLPPLPEDIWRADHQRIAAALAD
jgi:hypothetical protein